MLCANVLICRQKDYIPVHIIMELNENVAIPLRSMLMFYFVQAVCENLSLKKSIRVMDHLLDLIGGRDFLEKSGMTDYDGINRFSRGNATTCSALRNTCMICIILIRTTMRSHLSTSQISRRAADRALWRP